MKTASDFTVCKYCAQENTVGECCRAEFIKVRGIKRSYTFGVIPRREHFEIMFEDVNGGEPMMSVDGFYYDVDELFNKVALWGNDESEELRSKASDVMTKLGFEWI